MRLVPEQLHNCPKDEGEELIEEILEKNEKKLSLGPRTIA